MRVRLERVEIHEARTADEAYDGLERLVTGQLSAQVTRRADEIGYDIRSERAQAILELGDFSIQKRVANRKMGIGRRHDYLGLHSDGDTGEGRSVIHHHKTIELAPDVTSACGLIRARRNLPLLSCGSNTSGSRWRQYVSLADGDLDPEMLYPVWYHTFLSQGDVVDFHASGPITMVHLFTADPPIADRTIAVNFIEQNI